MIRTARIAQIIGAIMFGLLLGIGSVVALGVWAGNSKGRTAGYRADYADGFEHACRATAERQYGRERSSP